VAQPGPSPRKLAAAAMILSLIVLWAGFVATFAGWVGRWPVLVQALFYLTSGLVWILPLRPLVRWSQTGRWRLPLDRGEQSHGAAGAD
jgi:membrane protein implicated in regulation of membrane protease activity